MADQAAPDEPSGDAESPISVRVTIEPGPRGGARTGSLKLLKALLAAGAAALLVGAALSVATSHTSMRGKPPPRAQAALARSAGPVGVAAAYRYPLACLSVTIAAADPAYAAARLDRASPCWRFGAYETAIFHRVDGMWRMTLQTSAEGCSIGSVPAVVRAQLGLCDEGGAPAR
ncbi:MAG TPA: hypothetical protein VMF57_21190 [Solirubrobacteraceae bacterium]|nr:hypothetical protein [Solirubrobacteraceae bacterium]